MQRFVLTFHNTPNSNHYFWDHFRKALPEMLSKVTVWAGSLIKKSSEKSRDSSKSRYGATLPHFCQKCYSEVMCLLTSSWHSHLNPPFLRLLSACSPPRNALQSRGLSCERHGQVKKNTWLLEVSNTPSLLSKVLLWCNALLHFSWPPHTHKNTTFETSCGRLSFHQKWSQEWRF